MAEISDSNSAPSESQVEVGAGESSGVRAAQIEDLVAIAETVITRPGELESLNELCRTRLRAAAAWLNAAAEPRRLPLIAEIDHVISGLSEPFGAAVRAAVVRGMDLVVQAFRGGDESSRADELITIAELRSVRGYPPPWRNPLVAWTGEAEAEAAAAPGAKPESLQRCLADYRKSLLILLKSDSADECRRLAQIASAVAEAHSAGGDHRLWRAAGRMFEAAAEKGEAVRPFIKRLAVKLEQVLRTLSDEAPVDETEQLDMCEDMEVLAALLSWFPHDSFDEDNSSFPLKTEPQVLAQAIADLIRPRAELQALLFQLADAFLVDGDCARWLEASKLAAKPDDSNALRAAVDRWSAAPPADEGALLDEAEAEFDRIVGETGNAREEERQSGVPVDEALLENLNLMAREIRGARTRAEAKLGSLRGGLEDMEHKIRELRSQLEAMEVDAQVESSDGDHEPPGRGVHSKLGVLSRGIEELAGLKDALQALTEETETVLAAHAGDDTQLEQGLLQTRMTPVGSQFDALAACVENAAAGWGVTASIDARGADVVLERSQAEALTRALTPLLQACVREGLTSNVSPARSGVMASVIELNVHQPRFDVCVEVLYHGAPLADSTLAEAEAGINVLGAVCECGMNEDGRARLGLLVPGPPQPMEVLMFELCARRLALPLDCVTGVSPLPRGAPPPEYAGESRVFEGEDYPLASLSRRLGFNGVDATASATVMISAGDHRLACPVDSVIGRQRALVRSPGPLLSTNPFVLGAVIDGLKAPTLVLDVVALASESGSAAG